jgi:Tfp pilus assembly protein PilX
MKMIKTKKQTGSTLFICLLLLLAISIISLAGMRTSLLELVIANNKQQFSNTFQAAEEIIDTRMSTIAVTLTGAEVADQVIPGTTQTDTSVTNGAGQETALVTSSISYRKEAPASGWGLDVAVAHHFQVDATATASAKNAESQHRSGFFIVAPSAK